MGKLGSGTSTEVDSEVESPDPYPLLGQLANVEEAGERMEDDSSSSEGDVYHHYL